MKVTCAYCKLTIMITDFGLYLTKRHFPVLGPLKNKKTSENSGNERDCLDYSPHASPYSNLALHSCRSMACN